MKQGGNVVPEITGLTFRRDGQLYAISQTTYSLYRIDIDTAEAIVWGKHPIAPAVFPDLPSRHEKQVRYRTVSLAELPGVLRHRAACGVPFPAIRRCCIADAL